MIIALDSETIANARAVGNMPQPTANKKLKDPAKIAADIADKLAEIASKAALDPMTARVCCFAAVNCENFEEQTAEVINAATDEEERAVIQSIMGFLGADGVRLVTYNGIGFDLPMIYRRAVILGVDPRAHGAPPLSAWTRKYNTDRHFDLMQIWGGWSSQNWEKLETVAKMVLGEHREDIPYAEVPELIKTEEGRAKVAEGCINHTVLTAKLFNRFNGVLFA